MLWLLFITLSTSESFTLLRFVFVIHSSFTKLLDFCAGFMQEVRDFAGGDSDI